MEICAFLLLLLRERTVTCVDNGLGFMREQALSAPKHYRGGVYCRFVVELVALIDICQVGRSDSLFAALSRGD